MLLAESIDRILRAPVLVFGSLPPAGRVLGGRPRLGGCACRRGCVAGRARGRRSGPRVSLRAEGISSRAGGGAGGVALRSGPDADARLPPRLARGSPR